MKAHSNRCQPLICSQIINSNRRAFLHPRAFFTHRRRFSWVPETFRLWAQAASVTWAPICPCQWMASTDCLCFPRVSWHRSQLKWSSIFFFRPRWLISHRLARSITSRDLNIFFHFYWFVFPGEYSITCLIMI